MDQTYPGDIVGLNIKALDKNNMPCSSDDMDMVYKKGTTLWPDQGVRRLPDEEVVFLLTHTASNSCTGVSAEIHHQRVDWTFHNVGLNIKGLDKINMPCSPRGDMVYKKVSSWDRP